MYQKWSHECVRLFLFRFSLSETNIRSIYSLHRYHRLDSLVESFSTKSTLLAVTLFFSARHENAAINK